MKTYTRDLIPAVFKKELKGYGGQAQAPVKLTMLPKYIDCKWINKGETCDKCTQPDCNYKRRKEN